jgi:hypothetical protein
LKVPGRWIETIYANAVNYTVIFIGKDYAVEYDCGTSSTGVTNYCIHVMSREPVMEKTLFDDLIKKSEDLGLNPLGLPVKITTQEGC